MQSGRATTNEWRLEFPPGHRGEADPLMGWIGGADTQSQVGLTFPSREAAIAYAERGGIDYELELPPPRHDIRPQAYADNFRHGRADNWTH
jgi:hypothetical protein